jgi:hypothetical protein
MDYSVDAEISNDGAIGWTCDTRAARHQPASRVSKILSLPIRSVCVHLLIGLSASEGT